MAGDGSKIWRVLTGWVPSRPPNPGNVAVLSNTLEQLGPIVTPLDSPRAGLRRAGAGGRTDDAYELGLAARPRLLGMALEFHLIPKKPHRMAAMSLLEERDEALRRLSQPAFETLARDPALIARARHAVSRQASRGAEPELLGRVAMTLDAAVSGLIAGNFLEEHRIRVAFPASLPREELLAWTRRSLSYLQLHAPQVAERVIAETSLVTFAPVRQFSGSAEASLLAPGDTRFPWPTNPDFTPEEDLFFAAMSWEHERLHHALNRGGGAAQFLRSAGMKLPKLAALPGVGEDRTPMGYLAELNSYLGGTETAAELLRNGRTLTPALAKVLRDAFQFLEQGFEEMRRPEALAVLAPHGLSFLESLRTRFSSLPEAVRIR